MFMWRFATTYATNRKSSRITVNVFPFLCSIVRNCRDFHIQRKAKRFNLYIYSAYRSYERQVEIYNNSNNPNYVAIPGSSEHQTGLALDVATLDSGLTIHFKNTHEYDLLKNNCMNYGFIIRYPENMQSLTGYNFEPWHLRYVGRESSIYIMNNNLTLEQFVYKNFEL